MSRYVTLAESFYLNGLRHKANGDAHFQCGRSEYAVGSYKKAQRNFDRAKRFGWGQPETSYERACKVWAAENLYSYNGPPTKGGLAVLVSSE